MPGERARFVAGSMLLGAAAGLLVGQLAWTDPRALVAANQAAAGERYLVLLSVLVGAVAAGALAWLVALLGRSTSRGLPLDGHRALAPVALAGFVPTLVFAGAWDDPLALALLVSAFVVAVHWTYRLRAACRQRIGSLGALALGLLARAAPFIVAAGVLLYAAYVSLYTVLEHRRFMTHAFDLGIFDNLFANALAGHPFRAVPATADADWSFLAQHAPFALYLLLPIYALAPGPETLLVMQAVAVASGAIPVYRLGARHLSPESGCVLALAYLLYAPLHGAVFYDFHFITLAVPMCLFAIDLLDEGRLRWFWLVFAIALLMREDVALVFVAAGACLAWAGRQTRVALGAAAIASLWFAALRFVVMPAAGEWWFADIYADLEPADWPGFSGIMATMVSNPGHVFRNLIAGDKLLYALQLLAPLGFLPLTRPRFWILLAPGAAVTLLTTGYEPTTSIRFQYSALWIAAGFPAATWALASHDERSGQHRRVAGMAAMIAGTLVTTLHWGAIPPRGSFHAGFDRISFAPPASEHIEKRTRLLELRSLVPESASMAVSESELPHVSGHLRTYALRLGAQNADYLLYAAGSGRAGEHQALGEVARGRYRVVAERPGLRLLERVSPDPQPRPSSGDEHDEDDDEEAHPREDLVVPVP